MVPRDMSPRKRMEKMPQSSNTSASDHVKRAFQSTSENPDLHGRMKSSDRTNTSDGSRSRQDELMLQMMLELKKDLKDANQENSKLRQDLNQANQENSKLR